jgi:hypothetical protein
VDVMRWAGHKHVMTTLSIYTDAMGAEQSMAAVMEAAWE